MKELDIEKKEPKYRSRWTKRSSPHKREYKRRNKNRWNRQRNDIVRKSEAMKPAEPKIWAKRREPRTKQAERTPEQSGPNGIWAQAGPDNNYIYQPMFWKLLFLFYFDQTILVLINPLSHVVSVRCGYRINLYQLYNKLKNFELIRNIMSNHFTMYYYKWPNERESFSEWEWRWLRQSFKQVI